MEDKDADVSRLDPEHDAVITNEPEQMQTVFYVWDSPNEINVSYQLNDLDNGNVLKKTAFYLSVEETVALIDLLQKALTRQGG